MTNVCPTCGTRKKVYEPVTVDGEAERLRRQGYEVTTYVDPDAVIQTAGESSRPLSFGYVAVLLTATHPEKPLIRRPFICKA